jgi:type II secretory pathway pseudopilin PulG
LAIAGFATGYASLAVIMLLLPIAIPNFVKARHAAMANACARNLQTIEAAKRQWALDNRKKLGDVPTAQDLAKYLRNGVLPTCPEGGRYTIGGVGTDPVCSIPDHQVSPSRSGNPRPEAVPDSHAAVVAGTTPAVQPTNAVGVFVPAPDRMDMVLDPKRNVLYITAGDSVLRYQMEGRTLLPALNLGGDLRGIDISADYDQLAVADASGARVGVGIHLVDLNTSADTHVTFRAEVNEGGTYSVVFGADGAVWITSTVRGSGGGSPLRKYLPASKQTVVVAHISENSMLSASADRQYIAYAEGNSSGGDYGRFSCQATQLQPPQRANAYLYEIGISRDGLQLAVPVYGYLVLSGASSPRLEERAVIGAAYHPQRDFVFLAQAGMSAIRVYETAYYTMVKELDFGEKFGWVGNRGFQQGRLRVSGDGKLIFCTVQGGVRYAETGL